MRVFWNPLAVIVLPIVGCLICGLFGRFFGRQGAVLIASSSLGVACVWAWYILFQGALSGIQFVTKGFFWVSFISGGRWIFLVDSLSCIMFVVVLTVSFLVHVYSIKYMSKDPHIVRFFSYLSLFTTFMLVLVSGSSLLILFVGWEGVGLCSYLLINFWYTRVQANKAALKAMVVNRVGDVSFLAAGGVGFSLMGTLNFSVLSAVANFLTPSEWFLVFFGFFVLIAAVGKSAQIGLHTWLPDAMEGPTPVSALIHAATMVTAGVFLLLRTSSLIVKSSFLLEVVVMVGAVTAIFAGTVGLVQFYIKRVIAYSTCSQLGYMVLISGLSVFNLGLFHLFNHAFFKAMLFLGAGSVIHAASDEQDMRKYGLIKVVSPFLQISFFVASLALMGIPFLAGFYSKDIILESAALKNTFVGLWAYWIGLTAAGLTTAYSLKVLVWTFFSKTTFNFKQCFKSWHGLSLLEMVVLVILGTLAVWSGFLFKDFFLGFGSPYFQNTLFISTVMVDGEFLPFWIKIIPVFGIILFSILSRVVAAFPLFSLEIGQQFFVYRSGFSFLSHKWYFNVLQNWFICVPILYAGYEAFWIWDRLILEQLRFR